MFRKDDVALFLSQVKWLKDIEAYCDLPNAEEVILHLTYA